MAQNVNLDEIKNIPEEEFKKHLLEWIEDIDISKELHSKLRSDLFQKFGKTTLGRQIALQYQQTQRIVLSPLVLVINTLVAEFLYAQNCHFSLSVFNSEVPFKNTLPDFERKSRFRFNAVELDEILEALGLVQPEIYKSEIIRSYETPHERDGILTDSSLLFCVIKTLISAATSGDMKPQNNGIEVQPSKIVDEKCHQCQNYGKKSNHPKSDELHSKYFKRFYKYLELLSQHVVEISQNMKKLKESTKWNDKNSKSSSQSCRLNKRLDKITESLKNLSKSNRKARKVAEIIKSVTCLTNEIERCSGNMAKYSMALNESSKDVSNNTKPASTYSEWLNQLNASAFGQRFIKNLEIAQQKAMAREVEKIKEIFNEKLQTNRMLIKLHYKQKTLEKFRSTIQSTPANQEQRDDFGRLIDEKLRLLKEKEIYWQQCVANGAINKPDDNMQPQSAILKEIFTDAVGVSKEKMYRTTSTSPINHNIVHQVQPSVKKPKPINIEIFEEPLHPIEPVIDSMVHVAKNRLNELENESKELDQSFQNYLQKQNKQKQQVANQIAKVWNQYERAKVNMNKTFVISKRPDKPANHFSDFHDTVIPTPIEDHVGQLDEVTMTNHKTSDFENPYKKFQENLTKSMTDFTLKRESTFVINKEAAESTGNESLAIIQHSVEGTSADKNNQTSIPMKIKSIMKKPIDSEPKIQLTITKPQRNDHHSIDPSDTSSSVNLKNVSPLEDVHLSDSKPSETSIKSKRSNNSLKSFASDGGPVEIGNEMIWGKQLDYKASSGQCQTNNEPKTTNENVESVRRKMLHKSNPTSSESSDKLNISTGRKSTSSDDFWK